MSVGGSRERIVDAASVLLADGGPEAMTTRAVCEAAGVQAPAIYRFFGDKDGLLDTVTEHVFASYVECEPVVVRGDPVEDLRRGWDLHVGFGLANPAVYTAVYGSPRPGGEFSVERSMAEILAGRIRRIAEAGCLVVPEDRAVRLVHASARGTTSALLGIPVQERDLGLADLAREAAISAIVGAAGISARDAPPEVGAALTLRASLDDLAVLSGAERVLMGEWLDRIAATG